MLAQFGHNCTPYSQNCTWIHLPQLWFSIPKLDEKSSWNTHIAVHIGILAVYEYSHTRRVNEKQYTIHTSSCDVRPGSEACMYAVTQSESEKAKLT